MAETLQDFKAEMFQALANAVRIRILEVLREAGTLTVRDIQIRVGVEPANISQHLSILRSRGIVSTRRDGTSIWYAVAHPEVFEMLDSARAVFNRQLKTRERMRTTSP